MKEVVTNDGKKWRPRRPADVVQSAVKEYLQSKGCIKTSFGELRYDSNYERDRIYQLQSDTNIVKLIRCKDFIPYQIDGVTKNYNPDFYIEYKNGKKVVEEVKPSKFVNMFNNRDKFSAAKNFYKDKGIIYKVILENKIYGKKIA